MDREYLIFEKAENEDIIQLTNLRIAYLLEDIGKLDENELKIMERDLPDYFIRNLNKSIFGYVAKDNKKIVSCAFLLIVEKPMSPSFITGKTGTVLNVYTKPEYRHRGYAKQIMTMMLEDAAVLDVSVIELKSTDDGYALYKSVGFEDVMDKYHNMKIVLK